MKSDLTTHPAGWGCANGASHPCAGANQWPAANYRPNNDLTMQSKGEEKTKGSKVLN